MGLSFHEQVYLMRQRFEGYFSHFSQMMGEVTLEK